VGFEELQGGSAAMPQRGSEGSPGRRLAEITANHGLGSGSRLLSSTSRQSKN
jgi:hypothetical protein